MASCHVGPAPAALTTSGDVTAAGPSRTAVDGGPLCASANLPAPPVPARFASNASTRVGQGFQLSKDSACSAPLASVQDNRAGPGQPSGKSSVVAPCDVTAVNRQRSWLCRGISVV